MDPSLDLKEKGETTMKAEEIQLKITLQRDGQSAMTSKNKSVINMSLPLVFTVYSFILMWLVVGGDGVGRAVRGDTICFSIFFVADTLAFVASFAVIAILATMSHVSAKMDYFMRITLLAAAVFFVLSYHATAYALVPPNYKWIVLCFGGAVTIPITLLLFFELYTTFPKGSGMAS